jgi:hypothetical protein
MCTYNYWAMKRNLFLGSIAALVSLLMLGSQAYAGDFTTSGGSWSNFTGTGSSYTSLFTGTANSRHAELELRSTASGQNYTLTGTWSFTVTWTPANGSDTPPTSADVKIGKCSLLTVAGNGYTQITSGATVLDSMDGTDNDLSGIVADIGSTTVSVSLSAQPDGTYQGTCTVTSDLLDARFNSSTSDITKCMEKLMVLKITGVF